jgi:hypothetical protein
MAWDELTITDANSSSAATTAEEARDGQVGSLAIIKSELKPTTRRLLVSVTPAKVTWTALFFSASALLAVGDVRQ